MTDLNDLPTREEARNLRGPDPRNRKRSRGSGSTSPQSKPVPLPVPVTGDRVPELRELEEDYRAGRRQPIPVRLGEMPPDATPLMHEIADHMARRMGLRLTVDDDRPLPYATTEAVRAGFAANPPQASRAIARLVKAGVIRHVGNMPRRPGGPPDGTKLYAPPLALPGEAVGVEGEAEAVVAQPDEPHLHVVDEALVTRAEVAVGDGALAAPGDGADEVVGHDHDVRSGDGRLALDVYGSEEALIAALIEAFDATEVTA
jgi:hypothetical protein